MSAPGGAPGLTQEPQQALSLVTADHGRMPVVTTVHCPNFRQDGWRGKLRMRGFALEMWLWCHTRWSNDRYELRADFTTGEVEITRTPWNHSTTSSRSRP